MRAKSVRVSEILEDCGGILDLRVLVEGDPSAEVVDSEIGRPGLLLAGHGVGFQPGRLQILDEADATYLDGLPASERTARFGDFLERGVPCLVLAGGVELPEKIAELCLSRSIAVLAAGTSATQLTQHLSAYLLVRLAPESTVKGTLVDVHGVGILLTGKSGIGKSECALALVARGHRLVADDFVRTIARPPGILIGRSSKPLQSYVEVRGIGLVDIGSIFGIRALRRQKRIEIEVALEEWIKDFPYDRSGLEVREREIMGVRIPSLTVPLVPGKSVSVIVEVIALSHILKSYGYDSAGAFARRWIEVLRREGYQDFRFTDVE
jgi:HPr kinase/phosphorylase